MIISSFNICSLTIVIVAICSLHLICHCNGESESAKKRPAPSKKLPKDPMFITDIDLEHLYDQWEETDDEKLPEDELPAHKRPPPKVELPKPGDDTSELFKDPEKLMQATKKGKTVMTFVNIAGNPTKQETEVITQRWQVGLGNNHIKTERYVIADDRVIFVFHDGQQAFEAKDFILDQPECKEFSIDSKTWQGKGFPVEYPNAPETGTCDASGPNPKANCPA